MFPTPEYELSDASVYPPAEDTFILLDALELEHQRLVDASSPLITLEIGSGSGVVSAFLRRMLPGSFAYCTDVNAHALRCTRRTAELNRLDTTTQLELLQCDLMGPLVRRLKHSVDILLFNPPYVPSEAPATNLNDFYYAGGANGRETIDRIMPLVDDILTPNGVFYLVAVRENQIPELLSRNADKLCGTIILERQCGIEYLYVLRFSRRLQ